VQSARNTDRQCKRGSPRNAELRRHFFRGFWRGLGIVWPIVSGLIAVQLALGLFIGYLETWSVGEATYFTFVTGLTIGYGDITPKHLFTRIVAIVIGFIGILLTGIISAVGVRALQVAMDNTQE
jgi:Ion channel